MSLSSREIREKRLTNWSNVKVHELIDSIVLECDDNSDSNTFLSLNSEAAKELYQQLKDVFD